MSSKLSMVIKPENLYTENISAESNAAEELEAGNAETENTATMTSELLRTIGKLDANKSSQDKILENEDTATNSMAVKTWVMATKPVGSFIAGWKVIERFEDNIRTLAKSERCKVTSYCYPTGAKLVEATVAKEIEQP